MKLNITLGHNASAAIFAKAGQCLVAYEEERLTKVKGDSSFPKLAIEECLRQVDTALITEIRLSHWFNTRYLKESKYYSPKYLAKRLPNAKIVMDDTTHHDHHAQSVWNFSGTEDGLTIVADGFGNNEECITIYRYGKMVHKISGYENSLGLMFQYATSAAGLKENEDEYKLLGYEIHSTIDPVVIAMPKVAASTNSSELINYDKLNQVKAYYLNIFQGMDRKDIARIAQYTLETKIMELVHKYYSHGLIQLSGGVFYNVKLNNKIMRHVDNICVNPVAGDQGNVFGHKGVYFEDLYLGKRYGASHYPNMLQDIMESFIGDMEFGPRALGNTSTLAMPTMENVEKINRYNRRDTMMPMAPIVTREFFETNFEGTDIVVKSEGYMVISFDYKTMKPEWRGAAHYDPQRNVFTGRVQVIEHDHSLYELVQTKGGILINTSLNFHGTPIIYSEADFDLYQIKTNQ